MKNLVRGLLEKLGNKPVLIWGARMTGIGLARLLRSHRVDFVGFVDSDPSLQGRTVSGKPVFSPIELPKIAAQNHHLSIFVAVSIKEQEIRAQLSEMALENLPIIFYSDYCDSFYTVDIMGSCNLRCPSCPHGEIDRGYMFGRMDAANFEKVVDKIIHENELVTHVSLYSWGEPFLHSSLPRFVDYLHERNIAVALSTNLSFDSKYLKDVIRRSPDYLKISLSGFYPAAYNRTHTGGDIRLVKSNMYKIRYLMDKYRSNTYVDVNYHLYRDNNQSNLRRMQELCDELDFSLSTTYSLIMPLERCMNHVEGQSDEQTKRLDESLLVTVSEGIKATEDFESTECPFRENQINVNWDLTVPVCCTVFDRKETQVAENFLTITKGDINKNKKKVSMCDKCQKLGLPAYNLGFNRKRWDEYASRKTSLDAGG